MAASSASQGAIGSEQVELTAASGQTGASSARRRALRAGCRRGRSWWIGPLVGDHEPARVALRTRDDLCPGEQHDVDADRDEDIAVVLAVDLVDRCIEVGQRPEESTRYDVLSAGVHGRRQAVVPDLHEAAGQDVLHKAPDEFHRRQGDGVVSASREGDPIVLDRADPKVRLA